MYVVHIVINRDEVKYQSTLNLPFRICHEEFTPLGAAIGIFWDKYANIKDDDALDPCIYKPSTTMLLNMYIYVYVHVFPKEGFHLHAPSRCG